MQGQEGVRSSRTSRSVAARASLFSAHRCESRLAPHAVKPATRSSTRRRPDALTLFVALLVVWPLGQFIGLAYADVAGQVRDAGGMSIHTSLDLIGAVVIAIILIERVLMKREALSLGSRVRLLDRACRMAFPFFSDRPPLGSSELAAKAALVEALGSEKPAPAEVPPFDPDRVEIETRRALGRLELEEMKQRREQVPNAAVQPASAPEDDAA